MKVLRRATQRTILGQLINLGHREAWNLKATGKLVSTSTTKQLSRLNNTGNERQMCPMIPAVLLYLA